MDVMLISKKAGKALAFDDTNEASNFMQAVKMLNSVSSFKNQIPADWKEYKQGDLEFNKTQGDPQKAARLEMMMSDEVNKDEPNITQLYKIVMNYMKNAAFDIKRTKMENKQQKIREGLADLAAKAEQDHEIQMARSELYKLSKYSIKLHDLLKGISEAEGLPAWQQSYITKSADYISAVYHDLEYEKSEENKMAKSIDDAEEQAELEPDAYVESLADRLAENISKRVK